MFGTWKRTVATLGLFAAPLAGWLVQFGMPRIVDAIEGDPPAKPPVSVDVQASTPRTVQLGANSIQVATDPENFVGADSLGFVIPRTLQEIGRPPSDRPAGWRTWAYRMDGIDSPWTVAQITLQGNSPTPVLVQDMSVDVVRRGKPLAGTLVKGQPGGCGGVEPREVYVELDARPPTVESANPKRPPFPYALRRGEFQVLNVIAFADKAMYEWTLSFRLLVDGETHTIKVDDGGAPFRTTPRPKRQFAWLQDASGTLGWQPSGPPC
jgi:hypothetical protein